MISEYSYNGISWKDIYSPDHEDVKEITQAFAVNPIISQELLTPTRKPKVDLFKDYIYLVLHFPAIRHSHKEIDQEIDFIIGKNFLVTAHYDNIEKLQEFAKKVEVGSITEDKSLGEHGGFLFYRAVKTLYGGMLDELESIKSRLDEVETGVFSGKEMTVVKKISDIGRDLLAFKKTLKPHGETLELFSVAALKMFGDDFNFAIKDMRNEYRKIENDLNSYLEILDSIRETNIMLVSTKQNEIMKIITVIAFILLPLSIISSLLQVEIIYQSIMNVPIAASVIAIIMIIAPLALYEYTRSRKWF